MDIVTFVGTWSRGWATAWATHDEQLVGSLYAEGATFRSHPHRDVRVGAEGAAAYASWAFEDEAEVRCWFAEPFVVGEDGAAVEYWAISTDRAGHDATICGVALLRFREDGLVIEQRDYWDVTDGALEPYPGWQRGGLSATS